MDDGSVYVLGILPENPSRVMDDLIDPWLDIVEPDNNSYPYTVRRKGSDENDEGESAYREALRGLFADCKTARLGHAVNGRRVAYGDLSMMVTLWGPESSYHLAPVWEVWTDQYQFRPELQEGDTASDRMEQLVDLARTAHVRTPSVYTYAQRFVDPSDPEVHVDRERVCAGSLDELYWLTIFGPDTVEGVGRNALLSVESDRCEELSDGSVLLVVGDTPVERDVPAFRRIRDELA